MTVPNFGPVPYQDIPARPSFGLHGQLRERRVGFEGVQADPLDSRPEGQDLVSDKGIAFAGVAERRVEGGAMSSTVRPIGQWEVEVIAVGSRNGWSSVIRARVFLQGGPRVLWWQRTQGPVS